MQRIVAPVVWLVIGAVLMAAYSLVWLPHQAEHVQIANAINALHQRVTKLEAPRTGP